MKPLKYIALASVLALSLTACNNNRNSATLGGTQDTSNVAAGANAAGTDAATTHDTTKHSGTDSTSHGNANPSGHTENDDVNQSKNHRPK